MTYEAGRSVVETSHTAGKVFFTVATDEDLRKTWLGGADRLCSRVQSHSIPLALNHGRMGG
jgi:hypothetical protein